MLFDIFNGVYYANKGLGLGLEIKHVTVYIECDNIYFTPVWISNHSYPSYWNID